MFRIRRCRDEATVLHLLRIHASAVNARHVAAAFERWVTLAAGAQEGAGTAEQRQHDIWAWVAAWGRADLAAFGPRELATVLWGCARLRVPLAADDGSGALHQQQRRQQQWPAVLAAALAAAPAFNAIDLRMVLWAASARAVRVAPASWVAALLEQQAPVLARWQPSHWCYALAAAARTGALLPTSVIEALWPLTGSQLGGWAGSEVALLMWGVGRLGLVPPAPWLRAWYTVSARLLGEWSTREMCAAFSGLARLARLPQRHGGPAHAPGSAMTSAELMLPPPHWTRRLFACLYWTPDQVGGAHLGALLSALVALRVTPPEELLDRLLPFAIADDGGGSGGAALDSGHPAAAATADARWRCHLLAALAKLQHLPSRRWMAAWATGLHASLPAAAPGDLAVAVWALARLGEALPAPLEAEALLARCLEVPQPPPQLALLLWSLGQLGLRPPDAWLAHCWNMLLPALPHAEVATLCALLVGSVRLGAHPPPGVLAACRVALLAHTRCLSPAACVKVASAFAALRTPLGQPLEGALRRRVEALEARQGVSPKGVAQFDASMHALAPQGAGAAASSSRGLSADMPPM